MANDTRERKHTLVKKLAIVIIFVVLTILGVDVENIIPKEENEETLMLHMIDVGQGDSFLLIQDENVALIDFGEIDEGKNVVEYIKNLGITKLNYVFATHPHSDHMGGMYDVITNFEIEKIVMPNLENYKSTSNWYRKLRKELNTESYKIEYVELGAIYKLGDATMEILELITNPEDETNNYSAIMKVTMGDMDTIFTGDAEKAVEESLLAIGKDIDAEIIKIGHHGSNTSSTEEFLDEINPDYALISTGNKYGHPTKNTMKKLKERDIEVYRTDENGTVIVTITSNDVSFSSEPGSYLSGDEVKEVNK